MTDDSENVEIYLPLLEFFLTEFSSLPIGGYRRRI